MTGGAGPIGSHVAEMGLEHHVRFAALSIRVLLLPTSRSRKWASIGTLACRAQCGSRLSRLFEVNCLRPGVCCQPGGQVGEIVEAYRIGQLVGAGDLWPLGEASTLLIGDPILRRRPGGQGRVRPVRRHGIEGKKDKPESL